MTSLRTPLCLATLCVACLGCAEQGPPRAPIRGQVQLAGQPLPSGRVLFVPLAPSKGPAAAAVVVDGQFVLPQPEGPVLGPNRVEVEATPDWGFPIDDEAAFAKNRGRPLPADPIPAEFGRQSKLTVDVLADQENRFDIDIPPIAKRW